MKNYDVFRYGGQTRFRYGVIQAPTSQVAARVIFSCATKNGDRKKPNPHLTAKTIYTFDHGTTYVDECYLGQYNHSGLTGILGNFNYLNHDPSIEPVQQLGSLTDRCMEKIYDKIRGEGNFAIDLAESFLTLRMLRSTLSLKSLLAEFFTELGGKGGYKRTSGQQRLDYITKKWLEYRYGWMPLVHSIYDAVETLGGDHILNGLFVVKGRSGRKQMTRSIVGAGTYSNPTVDTTSSTSVRTEVGVNLRLDPSARIEDWTSLSPFVIAWELMPLSFVADWVVNVSQQLSLWENYYLYNSRLIDGYQTNTWLQETKRLTHGITKGSYPTYQHGGYVDGLLGDSYRYYTAETRTTYKNRIVLSSLPTPSGIRLKVSFGSKRQLDAAALIHQLVAKRFR